MENTKYTLIHWFRKGLRVHDNPALLKIFKCAQEAPEQYYVRPLFILDPGILEWMRVSANRWRFLQQTLEDLHNQLKALNSRLYVVRGKPAEVFPRLFKEWRVEFLTYETDIEPFALRRDQEVHKLAKIANVKVDNCCSHTIYNPEIVIAKNGGKAPITMQKFLAIVERLKVPAVAEMPKKLTTKSSVPKDSLEQENPHCYDYPTLEELVKRPDELGTLKFHGGETEGLKRLNAQLSKETWIATFEKPNTAPNSLEPSTTVLSPYLKFGCLSSRLFYHKLNDVLKRHARHTKPPVSLMGQLMWREFYYAAAAGEYNFDRMLGNSYCLQIPWEANAEHLAAWEFGRTGYPFIDAIMRQLRQEGWIHHLARHAVACFLTRGDLWISWEEGQRVFEELLLDADWALNAGNWLWLSASAFYHQYFRVYSPVAFGKKTDKTGEYIRKYVPELAKYPAGIIYEPWKATLSAQREYGCIIGKDYPHRIVDHDIVHKQNITKMSTAYRVNREVRTGKSEPEHYTNHLTPSSQSQSKRKTNTTASGSLKRRRKT